MNVIVVTNGAWDDTTAVGSTLSNWFSGWDGLHLSTMYSREQMPYNSCCETYYQVSLSNIVKNLFNPGRIGIRFERETCYSDDCSKESRLINSTRGKKIRRLFLLASEVLMSSKIWMNAKAKTFIREQKPDICFAFAISDPFRYHVCNYLQQNNVPLVLFIADDVYGMYSQKKDFLSRRYKRRFEQMIMWADKVYGASELMCERYSSLFGINITPLYKGCDISEPKKNCSRPVRITYAGNLYYGRDKTLGTIADVLKQINAEFGDSMAQLEIYSSTPDDDDMRRLLNVEGVSKLMGRRSYSDIVQVLRLSDIVIHVESFDPKQIEVVKYSFSTKITDCLQSGSALLVVGPKGIASVEYPKTIPGAIVIDDLSLLKVILTGLLTEPQAIIRRAADINVFAAKTFGIETIRNKIQSDFAFLTH